jgi:hypothetical protein
LSCAREEDEIDPGAEERGVNEVWIDKIVRRVRPRGSQNATRETTTQVYPREKKRKVTDWYENDFQSDGDLVMEDGNAGGKDVV